jgi:hypothetical protein
MTDGGRDSAAEMGTIETRIPARLDRLPGRFRGALREAVVDGRVKRLKRDQYAPVSK